MSVIQKFFEQKTIFLTGGTGYLGTALAEKILRSCSDIKKMYVLVRDKKNMSKDRRFEEWCCSPVLSNLAKHNSDALKKVVFIQGNLQKSQLGLNEKDYKTLIEEVNCVFHVGAEVNFVKTLHDMLMNNLVGTNEMILLGKHVKNLDAFVYVSTAFAQCNKSIVHEIMYESPFNSENILILLKTLDKELFSKMSTLFLEGFPNNYTFTKCLAEDLIKNRAGDLPVAVIRPTIVAPSLKEPIPGWTNQYQSYSQLVSAFSVGLLHVLPTTPTSVMDLIPLDYTVNLILAAAWSVSLQTSEKPVISVYNSATCHQNPISMKQHAEFLDHFDTELPSTKKFWHRFIILTTNVVCEKFMYALFLPMMYLLDATNTVMRKPRKYVKLYKKAHFFINITKYFTECTWLFRTDNTKMLWNNLDESDKKIFYFDVSSMDWYLSIHTFVAGIRLYVLKEKPNTLGNGQIQRQALKILHYLTVLMLSYLLWLAAKNFLCWCL